MSRTFRLTYDYLCPFARIANEAVLEALETGAAWEVTFHPFSLSQVHVDEGEAAVWERPLGSSGTRGTRAHAWALAVSEVDPDRFLAFHGALFAARHDDGADVDDPAVLGRVAAAVGLDPDAIADEVATGDPIASLAEAHQEAVKRWSVFGVPTFIAGDAAVFVRLMERHRIDDIERVLDLIEWPSLNEYKHTTIPR
jgi:predicted DsbA family dithiol-disulfide isomerase